MLIFGILLSLNRLVTKAKYKMGIKNYVSIFQGGLVINIKNGGDN